MPVLQAMDGKFYDIPDDQASQFEVPREKVKDLLEKSGVPADAGRPWARPAARTGAAAWSGWRTERRSRCAAAFRAGPDLRHAADAELRTASRTDRSSRRPNRASRGRAVAKATAT